MHRFFERCSRAQVGLLTVDLPYSLSEMGNHARIWDGSLDNKIMSSTQREIRWFGLSRNTILNGLSVDGRSQPGRDSGEHRKNHNSEWLYSTQDCPPGFFVHQIGP